LSDSGDDFFLALGAGTMQIKAKIKKMKTKTGTVS